MIFDECALKTLDVHQFAGALLLLHAALTLLFLKMFHNEKSITLPKHIILIKNLIFKRNLIRISIQHAIFKCAIN